jgi:hypothetical protein
VQKSKKIKMAVKFKKVKLYGFFIGYLWIAEEGGIERIENRV